MTHSARETCAIERETLGIRKLHREMLASLALLDDDADRIEIEAKLRRDLAEDIRKSGMKPFVVGSVE